MAVDEDADGNAIEHRQLGQPARQWRRGRCVLRRGLGWRFGGSPRGVVYLWRFCGRAGFKCFRRSRRFAGWIALKPRRELLRQFAERLAFDRAQARRFQFGGRRRRGWTKRQHVGGRRNDRQFRTPRRIGVFDGQGWGLGCWRLDAGHFIRRRGRRRRHETERPRAPRARQIIDAVEVAADAKAAITAELAVAIEYRQARKLDRQFLVRAIDRPRHDDAAPGLACRQRTVDLALGIEVKRGGDLFPRPAERRCRARAHQLDEFVRSDDEVTVGIHLPDEAQRMTPIARGRFGLDAWGRRRRLRSRFDCRRSSRRHFRDGSRDFRNGSRDFHDGSHDFHGRRRGNGRGSFHRRRRWLDLRSVTALWWKADDQYGRRLTAEAIDRERARGGMAARERIGSERLDAERRQRRRAGKPRLRGRDRVQQRAVGVESCQRLIVAREQALDAFGERQRRSGRFGCYDEDGRRLVGERDTRTGANEHAGEAGAEAAQTLKPGLAAVRQVCREARYLGRGWISGVEPKCDGARRGRCAEHGRPDGVRPQQPRSIGRPQPCRRCARCVDRKSRVAQQGEL